MYFHPCVCAYVKNSNMLAAILAISPVPSMVTIRYKQQISIGLGSCVCNSSNDGEIYPCLREFRKNSQRKGVRGEFGDVREWCLESERAQGFRGRNVLQPFCISCASAWAGLAILVSAKKPWFGTLFENFPIFKIRLREKALWFWAECRAQSVMQCAPFRKVCF